MKRTGRIPFDPVKAAERAQRRAERRAAEPPRPEDRAREERRAARLAVVSERKPTVPKRRVISEASPEQREAVALKACVARREGPCHGPVDPAHLIPRALCPDTDGDPRAVVPLCRHHHDGYDGKPGVAPSLDLLPYLEPHYRDELAFAVQRVGLLSTLRRVTNDRYAGGTDVLR